jgi:hypothetical protein
MFNMNDNAVWTTHTKLYILHRLEQTVTIVWTTHTKLYILHRLEQTVTIFQQIEFSEKTRKKEIEGKGYRSRKLLLSSRKALTNKKITIACRGEGSPPGLYRPGCSCAAASCRLLLAMARGLCN